MLKKPRKSPVLLGLILVFPLAAQASVLGVAGEYNIFAIHDVKLWGTDVEGRLAAGNNVPLGKASEGNGFAVARTVENPDGLPDLVAGRNVKLRNGSVGYFANSNSGAGEYQNGTIYYGPAFLTPGTVGAWATTTQAALVASQFDALVAGLQTPNFSPSGAPIEFGSCSGSRHEGRGGRT